MSHIESFYSGRPKNWRELQEQLAKEAHAYSLSHNPKTAEEFETVQTQYNNMRQRAIDIEFEGLPSWEKQCDHVIHVGDQLFTMQDNTFFSQGFQQYLKLSALAMRTRTWTGEKQFQASMDKIELQTLEASLGLRSEIVTDRSLEVPADWPTANEQRAFEPAKLGPDVIHTVWLDINPYTKRPVDYLPEEWPSEIHEIYTAYATTLFGVAGIEIDPKIADLTRNMLRLMTKMYTPDEIYAMQLQASKKAWDPFHDTLRRR